MLALFKDSSGQMLFSGTTIVIVRTPTELVVGADSKRVLAADKTITKSACKIVQVGDLFFAVAGIAEDTETGFSVASVAARAAEFPGTIRSKVKSFENSIVGPLRSTVEKFRHDYPNLYPRQFGPGANPLMIAFFGLEGTTPVLLFRAFKITSYGSQPAVITIDRRDCPGDCITGEDSLVLGKGDAIRRFMMENPTHLKTTNLVEAVRHLIEIEIEANPDEVDAPIDILRIDRSGSSWTVAGSVGNQNVENRVRPRLNQRRSIGA